MTITRNTAHLCGHFIATDGNALVSRARQQGWQLQQPDVKDLAVSKNYYYGEFVDFVNNDRFVRNVDKSVVVVLRDGSDATVLIDSLHLFVAPFGVVVFSIDLRLEGMEWNRMAQVLQQLRDNCHYDATQSGSFLEAAIAPVCSLIYGIGGDGDYQRLTENGNKLKIFQTIECDDDLTRQQSPDTYRLLYQMGCLQPADPQQLLPVGDDSYYNRIMETGRVAIFSDWCALALFDTFTMLSLPLSDFRREMWQSDYFGMIYLYCLFRQSFLYHYNALFRAKDCDIKQLEADILLFERRYCFERYSYNFLPLEIGRAMERSLELAESAANLHSMVTQAGAVYEKESDDKMNRVLTLLAIITICSTVWDLFSMINAAFVFKNEVFGFRIGVYILIIVLLLIWLIFSQSHRKKR